MYLFIIYRTHLMDFNTHFIVFKSSHKYRLVLNQATDDIFSDKIMIIDKTKIMRPA